MSVLNRLCPMQRIVYPTFIRHYATNYKNEIPFPSHVVNRNPRNLEKIRVARKPEGWLYEATSREYWHKLFFTDTSKYVSARIVHYTGVTVLRVASDEWAIRKHLYSATDLNAVVNVARVLAERCLHSGLHYVHIHFSDEEMNKKKVNLLLKTLEDGGLVLHELPVIKPKKYWESNVYDVPNPYLSVERF